LNNYKKIGTIGFSLLLSILLSLFMVTSCRKDVPKPDKYKYPPIDSCADAFYRYSSPSTWPERNWECDSGCIIGCEFHESARTYNYYMPAFNQSNPHQIVFYRVSNVGFDIGTYTFDFCTGKLRAMVTNDAYPMDWGSNNLLLYVKGGYFYTVKPNGDSITQLAATTGSPFTSSWSPLNNFVSARGSTLTKRDLFNNPIYSFPFPVTYSRTTWIDDNSVSYITSFNGYDSIYIMNLATRESNFICRISLHSWDSLPIKCCYDINNNSLYWTALKCIMRVNLITKEISVVRRCYDSIHFKEFDYSPAIGKFILVGEEINKKYPCGGSQD
jgi:hypothetical protein